MPDAYEQRPITEVMSADPFIASAAGNQASINDPSRWTAFNDTGAQQGNMAQYFARQAMGQGPSMAAMQQAQGQDAAIRALRSNAMSSQRGYAPGLTQANMLQAMGDTQGQITQQGMFARLAEQNQAAQLAGGMYGQLANQQLGMNQIQGNQANTATGIHTQTGIGARGQDVTMRGQDITQQMEQERMRREPERWQREFDERNSVWNKYILPSMSMAAGIGGSYLMGGGLGSAVGKGLGEVFGQAARQAGQQPAAPSMSPYSMPGVQMGGGNYPAQAPGDYGPPEPFMTQFGYQRYPWGLEDNGEGRPTGPRDLPRPPQPRGRSRRGPGARRAGRKVRWIAR